MSKVAMSGYSIYSEIKQYQKKYNQKNQKKMQEGFFEPLQPLSNKLSKIRRLETFPLDISTEMMFCNSTIQQLSRQQCNLSSAEDTSEKVAQRGRKKLF